MLVLYICLQLSPSLSSNNFIDEMALLKAFIDNKTLSYTEVQEKGIVPVLNKQDRRVMFKNTIDKFKKWELIESIPDSDPKAWTVIPDKAASKYDKLIKEIEQKQLVDKYSFAYIQEEIKDSNKKLEHIRLYKVLAVIGFILATISFTTGLTLISLIDACKHIVHSISGHIHL